MQMGGPPPPPNPAGCPACVLPELLCNLGSRPTQMWNTREGENEMSLPHLENSSAADSQMKRNGSSRAKAIHVFPDWETQHQQTHMTQTVYDTSEKEKQLPKVDICSKGTMAEVDQSEAKPLRNALKGTEPKEPTEV